MSKPDHNEKLSLAKNISKTFPVTGYAYTGGGRKVTRVEVSTDQGLHWHLSTLDPKEQPTQHGMYWCWVWWTYDLPVADLVGCKEIWCRAWDASNNTQPNDPTWNLMGMGNNQVFRIKVHLEQSLTGEHVFRFEHPTQPGQQTGGWMTRVSDKPVSAGYGRILEEIEASKDEGSDAAAPVKKDGVRTFTLSEVRKHNHEKDCWIIIKDRVYDATEYLDLHPGGIESIVINAGQDATEDFVAIHSSKATKMLEKYYIGDLDKSSVNSEEEPKEEELVDEQGRKVALNPRKKTPFRLQNKIVLSRDTILLDFALPTPEHILGLPTGKHMFLSAKIDGETVLRRYTPISSNYDVGCVKFVIKVYYPCERFPNGGKMSQYVNTLKIGDYLDMKGPVGEFEYSKDGAFAIDNEPCNAKCFNMIAGGTGITPVMQIAAEILRHPEDPTQMSLIFACRIEEDLLMRSTLDDWATNYPAKFKVHYILSDSWPSDWKYSTGFVDQKLFEEYLFEPSEEVYNLMCGPPIMLEKGVTPALNAVGHQKKNIFAF
jgi:nitrate reductase (NAD(P)H)